MLAFSREVRTANSRMESGEKFRRKPPMLSPPSRDNRTFKPELPPNDAAVILVFVGFDVPPLPYLAPCRRCWQSCGL